MIPKKNKRYLAAILFTDIEGYTAMMHRDEEEALIAVRRHREVMEKMVPNYDGEIHQFYGDGCLCIFQSSMNAVQCALECQKTFLQEPAVPLRMGIHIGEIFHEDDKIYGDGVNVASRIESIGQAGTVLFSGQVFEKIRNNKVFKIKSIGKFNFKNVDEPIEVFALANPEIRFPDLSRIEGKLKKPRKRPVNYARMFWIAVIGVLALSIAGILFLNGEKGTASAQQIRSIAVLPFNTTGLQSEDTLFSVGIAEDILTQLSKLQDLKVISRASSFQFDQESSSSQVIARELGVSSILKGSVRKYDKALRISVQLINPEDDSYIWAEQYNGEIGDVLKLQQDVAMSIFKALKIELSPRLKEQMRQAKTVNVDAWYHYQKGQEKLKRSSGTQADIKEAINEFEKALSYDPDCSLAYVGLAECYLESIFWHRVEEEVAIPKAKEAAYKALELDPNIGECYGIIGAVDLYLNNLGLAKKNLERALEMNPNYSFGHERLAWVSLFLGDTANFRKHMDMAIELDPLSTRYKGGSTFAYYLMGNYEVGLKYIKEYLNQFPGDNFLLWNLGYLYAGSGQYDRAIEVLETRTIGTYTNWVIGYCYAKLGNTEKAREILNYHLERAKNEYVPHFMIAVQYAGLGENDAALDYLDQSAGIVGESIFLYALDKDPMWDGVRNDPRFEAIVRKWKSTIK